MTITVMVSLSLPIGLVTVHVYVPLSLVITLLTKKSARNTEPVLVWVTVVILVDCTIGPLSFLHVNVSGGEPREIQDNVREDLIETLTGDRGESIIGAAV